MPPPDPFTDRLYVPGGADAEVLTVNVEAKLGDPELGLKLQDNQFGGVFKEREIEGDPLCKVAVMVYVVCAPPAVIERLVGDAERR